MLGLLCGTYLILEFTRKWKTEQKHKHRMALFKSLYECVDLKKTHPDTFCSRVLKLRG